MKILATFLGANPVEEKTLNPLIRKWNSPHFKPLDGRFLSGHELKFDSDWNWLLAIVQKATVVARTADEQHWHTFAMLSVNFSEAMFNNDIRRAHNECVEIVKYVNIHKIKF